MVSSSPAGDAMFSKVGIVCFAASYAVALALELTRLLFRSGVRGAALLGFTGAGFVAHSAFLFYQGVAFRGGSPLSSSQHWYLTAAWALVVVYLFLACSSPRVQFGLFFLPLALALIGVAYYFADAEPARRAPDSRLWGAIHGGSLLVATVAISVGFAAGAMYLGQARRLKRKLPPLRGLRLPSLEWLQKANSRSLHWGLAALGAGLVSGAILNLLRRDPAEGVLPWNDPLVLSTAAMFGWLAAGTIAGWFYRPAREGRKVAYFTLVSFAFLAFALAAGLFLRTEHGGGHVTDSPPARGAAA